MTIVAAAPTLTSPTATIIANTTATLGANITSNGGAALTARGTCWGTTAAPVTNCLAAGGTATGVFTQARTALTAGSLLYYRGYATNSVNTSHSPDGSFYTEPTTQASAVSFTGVTSTGMTVNWTRGSGGAGGGVIVLMKSLSAVTGTPTDGTYASYTPNTTFGSGTLMLEMAGIPYTGSTPRAHGLCLDKVMTKLAVAWAGVLTPRFCSIRRATDFNPELRFPLVVKPRYESTSLGLALVHEPRELEDAVESIVAEYQQDALVEEYIDGREVAIGLLGNDPVEILPIVELDFGERRVRIMTKPDKFHRTEDEPAKLCPAPLESSLARDLRELARNVYRACGCRDYARIDIRLDAQNRPFVLEVNSMASLGQGGAYVRAAQTAGYSFDELVCRIVDHGHERYFGGPAARELNPGAAADGAWTEDAPDVGRLYSDPAVGDGSESALPAPGIGRG